MSTGHPRVRDACEPCHRRKIKCMLEPGNTACTSCFNGRRDDCLFAPRAKAGRPRRTQSSHQQQHHRRKIAWAQTADKVSKTQIAHGHTRSSSDSMAGTMAYSYWDIANVQDLTEGVDFLAHGNSPLQEEPEAQITQNELVRRDQTQPNFTPGLLTPTNASTSPMYDIFASADEPLDFDTALKLCGDLDRSHRALRDGQTGAAELEGILKIVEFTCTTARTSSISSAENALVLAWMFKVFELCETFISALAHDVSTENSLEDIFQLKRLDLALLQGFMFLSRVNQDALKKISGLHAWIESILQQPHYQAVW